ncbi:MAG TPA: hypothetical protein PKI60_01850 [Oscillospiraceae bacterium]|nr:hypothetical protein [Oscillospiraceae bacterium]
MFKKIFAFFLTAIISVSFLGTSVSATMLDKKEDIIYTPDYLYTYSCTSILSISGGTATCISELDGYYGETTSIYVSQALQKRVNGTWTTVSSWYGSTSNYYLSVTNYKSSLTSGTYRLASYFTVYAGSNSESINKFSMTATC